MERKAKAIIQVRLGSTRLPGKAFLKILDRTILEYVVERVSKARLVEDVIVATTTNEEDRQIEELLKEKKVLVFRGSSDDVLDRYYQAAKKYDAAHIVRITADCPLIDPLIIDQAVNCYFSSAADYCSNVLERTFPDGEDVEVFNFDALESAWINAAFLSEREHVTPYIRKHPEKFKLANFKNQIDLSLKRWTLDHKEDFIFIKSILEYIYPRNVDFHMQDILDFLKINSHIEEINKYITPAEGYAKSLEQDRKIFKRKL